MTAAWATTWSLTVLLAACRCVGVVCTAPPSGHPAVPVRVRLMLGLVLAVAVAGRLESPVAVAGLGALLGAVVMELLLGVVIGFAARVVLLAAELAAELAAQQMGIALADALVPGQAGAGGAMRGLFGVLAVTVFVTFGGAEALAEGLLGSFTMLPPGGPGEGAVLLRTAVGMLGASFSLGLKLAGPMLTAMLLATVAMGCLQRAMPQCTIFSVGLPVRAMLGLVVLAGTAMVMGGLLESGFAAVMDDVRAMMERAG